MTLHRSLKGGNELARHRNVLTREERLEKLEEERRWNDEKSIMGLPKVRNIKVVSKKKKKEAPGAAEGEAAAVEGEAAAPAAEGAS